MLTDPLLTSLPTSTNGLSAGSYDARSFGRVTVPGALEIPGAISLADQSQLYDGYVAIGVVIRGETYHFEIVAGESARGIMALTMDGLAIGNGILTVENEAQALVRADPAQKDKGGEAAKAAIALLELREKFA